MVDQLYGCEANIFDVQIVIFEENEIRDRKNRCFKYHTTMSAESQQRPPENLLSVVRP